MFVNRLTQKSYRQILMKFPSEVVNGLRNSLNFIGDPYRYLDPQIISIYRGRGYIFFAGFFQHITLSLFPGFVLYGAAVTFLS